MLRSIIPVYNCELCTNRSYRPSITIRLTCWSHSREPTPILPPLSPSPLHRTDPHLGAGVELVRKAVPVVSGLPRCCSTTLSSSPFIARRYPWVVGLDPWVLMTHSAFSEDRQLILLRQISGSSSTRVSIKFKSREQRSRIPCDERPYTATWS